MAPVSSTAFRLVLADESETARLAADLAVLLAPGDWLTLSGPLGSGKTALARALIRALAGDPALDVPSPSFALVQHYDLPRFRLVHADFYRADAESELQELGLDAEPDSVVVVEWPEKFPNAMPVDAIHVRLSQGDAAETRIADLSASGAAAPRLARLKALRDFVAAAGLAAAPRVPMAGDASSRAYDRVLTPERPLVLMNAPRRPDGPPVRGGLPYSRIAHLAEDVTAFAGIARGLSAAGFSAPEIVAADLDQGFLLLEDLGGEGIVAGTPPTPIGARYEAAMSLLAALHSRAWPDAIEAAPGVLHSVPRYDMGAFLIEVELLLDWYLPHFGVPVSEAARAAFLDAWHAILVPLLEQPVTWTLRDFHSPNILWLAAREGVRQIGLIDFQDCVLGPPAYDVASLAQDARVDIDEHLELRLIARYVAARASSDPAFAPSAFAAAYAAMAAQRATKILGIFVRLNDRDNKPHYLPHIPRIQRYLRQALAHPSLLNLREWFAEYGPAIVAAGR